MSAAFPVGHILKGKMDRFSNAQSFSSFSNLKELSNMPDIASYILSLPLGDRSKKLIELMKLRRSKKGKNFRTWFHKNYDNDPKTIVKNYIEVLGRIPLVNTLPSKIVRFFITSASGIVNPIVGSIAGVGDSFVIDNLSKGYNPKIFINSLKQIPNGKK